MVPGAISSARPCPQEQDRFSPASKIRISRLVRRRTRHHLPVFRSPKQPANPCDGTPPCGCPDASPANRWWPPFLLARPHLGGPFLPGFGEALTWRLSSVRWGTKLAGGTGRGCSALRPANGLGCEVWGFGGLSSGGRNGSVRGAGGKLGRSLGVPIPSAPDRNPSQSQGPLIPAPLPPH